MRKLVFVAFALVGLQAGTGCIISSDDDDGGSGTALDLFWTCPSQADTLEIEAFEVGASTGIPDSIDCAETQPARILYDAGEYDLYVTPVGAGTFVTDYDTFGGPDGSLTELTFDFPEDFGFLYLTWTIDGDDATAASCSAVGADGGVSVLATLVGTDEATDDLFDCDLGAATTDEVPVGDHTVDVSLLDENDIPISEPNPIDATVDFGSELEDLGNFDFVTI